MKYDGCLLKLSYIDDNCKIRIRTCEKIMTRELNQDSFYQYD